MEPTVTTRLELAGRSVVAVHGEVDLTIAPVLERHLVDLLATGRCRFIVDLGAVTFIDSIGLKAIAAVLRQVREFGGSLRLVTTSEQTRKLLDVTGLTPALPAHHSVAEALAADVTAERRAGNANS